jgi:hypothetical protein
MLAKALRTVSSSVSSSVSRVVDAHEWAGLGGRGKARAAEAGQGFYESSFDLRSGLDVAEASLHTLPDEVAREFRRQRLG